MGVPLDSARIQSYSPVFLDRMGQPVHRLRTKNNMRRISFVVPAKDEQHTLSDLVDGILASTDSLSETVATEIIFVDDGSTDDTWSVMQALVERHPRVVRAFRMRRNFGKAAGLEVGFEAATGDIVFTMDADLQDDPKEIGRFLEKIDSGYDLVSGWKQKRNDPLSKTLPSKVFNAVTSRISGVKLHDFNCGFKAYRREVLKNVRIYGELHRYIPVLAQDLGFRVGEIPVTHHARTHGVSKYGMERYVRGFLDLITILAITRYLQRPSHLLGGSGVVVGLAGLVILVMLSVQWLLGQAIDARPLFFLGLLLVTLSIQLISVGILAELFVRSSSNPRKTKGVIAERIGDTP